MIDLNSHMKDVTKLIRPLMGDDVEIVTQPRCPSAIVEIDPGQLDQIVLNLAVNSRDAMPRGGRFILETSLVELDDVFIKQHRPTKPGRYVVLAVSDNGVGMDVATVSRIFEPFFTTKEVGKGTGLGLATVYGIVQQNNGPGMGLQRTQSRHHLQNLSAQRRRKTWRKNRSRMTEAPVRRREGTTIVLVEDDEIMLSLTRQLLLENGYTVLQARDGNAALEIVRSHPEPIHLLLTDVVMRGMGGPELVAEVQSSHPEVNRVFMSGYTGELIAQAQPASYHSVPLLEKAFYTGSLIPYSRQGTSVTIPLLQRRNHPPMVTGDHTQLWEITHFGPPTFRASARPVPTIFISVHQVDICHIRDQRGWRWPSTRLSSRRVRRDTNEINPSFQSLHS